MRRHSRSDTTETTHVVRPRWTWVALLVMVSGLTLAGVGASIPSWGWAVPGLVLLMAGGACALYGGFFYDVQGSASAQIREALAGDEIRGPDPRSTRTEAEVKRDVHKRWLDDDE